MLDLGDQPAADHFPAADDPGPDPVHPLRMWLCAQCGLANLAEDPTTPEEPRGAEPQAMVDQARDAVARVQAAGLLTGPDGAPRRTVTEFGSPHGGSWLDLLDAVGLTPAGPGEPADLVVDCFGLMHAADQAAGLAERAAATAPGGTLLLQFHSLAAIVADGGWNALRHGHFAYYSTPVLVRMLAEIGFEATHAFWFDLYGGTVLLAARRTGVEGATDGPSVEGLVERETALGVLDPGVVGSLESATVASADALRAHLTEGADGGPVGHRLRGGVPGGAAAQPRPHRARPAARRRRRVAGQAGSAVPRGRGADRGPRGGRPPPSRRGRPLRHRPARRDADPHAGGGGRRVVAGWSSTPRCGWPSPGDETAVS